MGTLDAVKTVGAISHLLPLHILTTASPHSELVLGRRLWPMPLLLLHYWNSKWLVTPLSHCKASSLRNLDDSPFAFAVIYLGNTLLLAVHLCLSDRKRFTKLPINQPKITQKKCHFENLFRVHQFMGLDCIYLYIYVFSVPGTLSIMLMGINLGLKLVFKRRLL